MMLTVKVTRVHVYKQSTTDSPVSTKKAVRPRPKALQKKHLKNMESPSHGMMKQDSTI